MDSQITTRTAADENAIRAIIHQRMIDAWNAGDAAAFAAPFTDEADFVAFEGTHLKGRREIALFHQRIFDTSGYLNGVAIIHRSSKACRSFIGLHSRKWFQDLAMVST